jgi:asparagine synthase (glutamine-hydrolysing)
LAEDILKKVDMASMQNSLEVRVPFLDYRLVSLVLSLPQQFKIKFFKTAIRIISEI